MRGAAPGDADAEEVAVAPRDGVLGLVVGIVSQCDGPRRQVVEGQRTRKRGRPRRGDGRQCQPAGGVTQRVDEAGQGGGAAGRVPVTGGRAGADGTHLDSRAIHRPCLTAGMGHLHDGHVVGPSAQHRPAGPVAGQLGGVGPAEHVVGLGRRLHAQRDPKVGVGPDVVGHHAGRPLRGQHEVEAQAAAPLRDADEGRHEVG